MLVFSSRPIWPTLSDLYDSRPVHWSTGNTYHTLHRYSVISTLLLGQGCSALYVLEDVVTQIRRHSMTNRGADSFFHLQNGTIVRCKIFLCWFFGTLACDTGLPPDYFTDVGHYNLFIWSRLHHESTFINLAFLLSFIVNDEGYTSPRASPHARRRP